MGNNKWVPKEYQFRFKWALPIIIGSLIIGGFKKGERKGKLKF